MSTEAVAVQPPGVMARRLSAYWHIAALSGVLGLAALLDFYKLSQNGYANTYYAAAVKSMLHSWSNFFFVSFDPGGLVSVDKPPLALWLEAASVKIFGYSGFTILLPEALAGVAAVWLLYLLIARYFGRVAGLVAALALAVSPVSVAVNRDNNPDALLALLLVAAAYVGARAVESGRLRTLVLAAVLVGLAFNTKMLAAAIVVPALGAAYLCFARRPWPTRLAQLAVAAIVLVAVSGAWIAAVDFTPAGDRPYVGSTSDNSALSLALDYNGLGRVTGQEGGTSFGGAGGLGGVFSGSPGFFRLLNDALGDQGAWLFAFAIVGGLSAAIAAIRLRRRWELAALTIVGGWFLVAAVIFSFSSGIIHTYYLSALAPATSGLVGLGAVALWRDARGGGWRVALPVAAIGLSVWLEVALLRRSGYLPWLQVVVIVTAVVAAVALAAVSGLVKKTETRALIVAAALAIGLGGLLAAPLAWSTTTWKAAVSGVFPGAGPSFVAGLGTQRGGFGFGGFGGGGFGGGGFRGRFGPGGPGQFPPRGFRGAPPGGGGGQFPGGFGSAAGGDVEAALAYVRSNGATKRLALIVSSEQEAAPYVIRGESVAAMGGFTGRETVLTNAYLAKLVGGGEARYFLLGGNRGFGGPGGTNNAAVSTISSICPSVPGNAWASSSAGVGGGATLYDCAGKANALAHAAVAS